jgi:hypothetical protein
MAAAGRRGGMIICLALTGGSCRSIRENVEETPFSAVPVIDMS